ncbi:MAG: hypothetical protein ACNA7W_10445 [Pseudomonadales bacterium]
MRFPPASIRLPWLWMWVWLLASLGVTNSAVAAQCGCFCVDGAPVTLCASVDAAQANVDACGARASERCPVSFDVPARQVYPSPVEGATNCRDVYVHDAEAGAHAARKVCDVEPEAGA